MSIQYIHRVSEKLAPDLGLSEKLPPSLAFSSNSLRGTHSQVSIPPTPNRFLGCSMYNRSKQNTLI